MDAGEPINLTTSFRGKTEKKASVYSRYLVQTGNAIYQCYDFMINSRLLVGVRDVAGVVFPKIAASFYAAGPYVSRLKGVAVFGLLGAFSGLSRSLRYVRRYEGSERVNYLLKTIHYLGVILDNTEKLILAAHTFKWINKISNHGYTKTATLLKTAVTWSRTMAFLSWFLTLSTIARKAHKIGQMNAFKQEFNNDSAKENWVDRNERQLKKMLRYDGAKLKNHLPQVEETTFKSAVERRLNRTLGEHKVQFLALTLNFASTALIYTSTASTFGYVYLGGYFAATVFSSLSRKVHDYQFQHEIGLCVAPQSGRVAKIKHIAKWILNIQQS